MPDESELRWPVYVDWPLFPFEGDLRLKAPTIRDAERLPNQTGFIIPPHHTLEEIEKLAILQTLERTRGNKRKAASILGVYRPTLYNKLKKYNLMETQERAPRQPAAQPSAPAAAAPPVQEEFKPPVPES